MAAGTFFYHSTMEQQTAQGLIGAFIVLPRNNTHILYRDYILLLQPWDISQPKLGEVYPGLYKTNKFNRNPNFFHYKW
jgi:FtsP/CotA-like multicopper oxidase with cupredoxin domain